MRELNICEADQVSGGGIKVDSKGKVTTTKATVTAGKDGSVEIQSEDGWSYRSDSKNWHLKNARGEIVDCEMLRWLRAPRIPHFGG